MVVGSRLFWLKWINFTHLTGSIYTCSVALLRKFTHLTGSICICTVALLRNFRIEIWSVFLFNNFKINGGYAQNVALSKATVTIARLYIDAINIHSPLYPPESLNNNAYHISKWINSYKATVHEILYINLTKPFIWRYVSLPRKLLLLACSCHRCRLNGGSSKCTFRV